MGPIGNYELLQLSLNHTGYFSITVMMITVIFILLVGCACGVYIDRKYCNRRVTATAKAESQPQSRRGVTRRVEHVGTQAVPSTREQRSQAPTTYTELRGATRPRFLPLSETSHG
jgi:hypothetical protein